MSEISLKQYLGRIDALLEENAYSEAVYHCRHVLQYFPKHIATYRRLGQALVGGTRWEEAGEVLRRVLSVAPDDFGAHYSLSLVYQRTRRLNDALWHLERAFEQDPNNQTLLEAMRDLYRQAQGIEPSKIQLTAGAVARQYARNQLYDQAVVVIRKALEGAPDRVDLRLVLARVLYEAGRRVEAAEVSLEVLRALPDCLDANVILTDLWLSEQRPSDAQRYISRIEPVDPYLALELAQGAPASDDAFELPELDYQAVAKRDLVAENPDWLSQIDSGPATEAQFDDMFALPDDLDAAVPSFQAADDPEDDDTLDFPDNWMEQMQAATGASAPAEKPSKDDWFSELDALAGQPTEKTPTTPRRGTGRTGLLAALHQDDPEQPESSAAADDDLMSMFADASERTSGMTTGELAAAFADADDAGSDPLAWMRGSDVELAEDDASQSDSDFAALFGDDDFTVEPTAHGRPATSDLPASDAADPFAWMAESGIELVDGEQSRGYDPYALEEPDSLNDPTTADPMAWLKDSGVELTDDEPVTDSLFVTDDGSDAEDESDPFAWLRPSGVELVEDEGVTAAEPSFSDLLRQPEESARPSTDWLADDAALDEMFDIEALTSDTGELAADTGSLHSPENEDDDWLTPEPSAESAGTMSFDTQKEDVMSDQDDFSSWFDADPSLDDQDADEELNWLSENAPQSAPEPQLSLTDDDGGEPDDAFNGFSLDDQEDEQTPITESGSAWMTGSDEPNAVGEAQDDEAADDWLTTFNVFDSAQSAPAASSTEDDDLLAGEFEDFDWSAEDADSAFAAALDPSAGEDNEMPDWLSEVNLDAEEDSAPTGLGQSVPMSAVQDEETPDWMMTIGLEDEEDDETVSGSAVSAETDAEGLPDWLAGARPVMEEASDAEELDTFAWDLSDEDETALGEPAPAAALSSQAPNWLMDEAEEQAEDQGFGADEDEVFDLQNIEWDVEDEETEFGQPVAQSETPNWLAESEADEFGLPVMEFGDSQDTEIDVQPWDGDQSTEFDLFGTEAQPTAESAAPNWLDTLGEDEENEASAPMFASASLDDDLSGLFDEQDDELASSGEMDGAPDWMSEPDSRTEEAIDPYSWDVQPVDESAPWLNQLGAAEPDEAAEPEGESFSWLSTLNEEDEPEAEESAPQELDWMLDDDPLPSQEAEAGGVPGFGPNAYEEIYGTLDDDYAAEDEPTFEEMMAAQFEDEAEADLQGEEDFAFAEMSHEATDSAELAPTPASNAPDWLNAMVPGLDVDYAAAEDAPLESEYVDVRPQPAKRSTQRDYAWLTNIIREETSAPPALPEAPGAATRRRFSFSRPPSWLRRMKDRSAASAQVAPAATSGPVRPVADETFDLDREFGEDLPPWLSYNEDDEVG